MSNSYESVNPHRRHEAEDTSMKKYPNNKYFHFQDEESSGRKYIKDTFNLSAANESVVRQETSHRQQQVRMEKENDSSRFNLERDYERYCQPHRTKEKPRKVKSTTSKMKNKKQLSVSHTIGNSINCSTVRNSTKPKKEKLKITINKEKEKESCQLSEELKHYKKLCLDMRKKNTDLAKELSECKETSKTALNELQKKVDKFSVKIHEKKENVDSNKMEKIMESLKHINGKLNKKNEKPLVSEGEKFYHFFVESLDILREDRDGEERWRGRMSVLEAQTTWKQILQFLINHDYRLNGNSNIKTIR